MNCFSLMLGARSTSSAGRRFLKKDDRLIRTITAEYFPEGFTILNAEGGWFDPAAKKFVEEDARQLLVCTAEPQTLRRWCEALATRCDNESYWWCNWEEPARSATNPGFSDIATR